MGSQDIAFDGGGYASAKEMVLLQRIFCFTIVIFYNIKAISSQGCFIQTCEQVVEGRNFNYQRALEIVQDEEYLEDSDFEEIRRHDIVNEKPIKYYQKFRHTKNVHRQDLAHPK